MITFKKGDKVRINELERKHKFRGFYGKYSITQTGSEGIIEEVDVALKTAKVSFYKITGEQPLSALRLFLIKIKYLEHLNPKNTFYDKILGI